MNLDQMSERQETHISYTLSGLENDATLIATLKALADWLQEPPETDLAGAIRDLTTEIKALSGKIDALIAKKP